MDFAIVDLQGFIHNEDYVVKEICILTKNLKFHEIVKSPSSFTNLTSKYKQQVKWLENNYHGLRWSQGYITVEELRKTITPILNGKSIFLKGLNKIRWLQGILNSKMHVYVNVEDMGCNIKLSESFFKESVQQGVNNIECCKKHKFKNNHCALRNASVIRQWYLRNETFNIHNDNE